MVPPLAMLLREEYTTDSHDIMTPARLTICTIKCVTFATAMCGRCVSSDVVMSLSLVSVHDTREGALSGDTIDLHAYVCTYIRTKNYRNSNVHNITQIALLQVLCMKRYHETCSQYNVLTLVGVKAGHQGAKRRGRFALCCVCAQPDERGAVINTSLHPQAHTTTVHTCHTCTQSTHHHTLTHCSTPSHTLTHCSTHHHTPSHTTSHHLTF